jgi:hypothetical protein
MAAMHPLQGGIRTQDQARRLLSFQRSYTCGGCETEHRSWARLHSCPDCGHSLSVAVIRRAALVGPV